MLEYSNHRETQVHSAMPLRREAGGFTGTFQTRYSKLLQLSHYCLVTVSFTFYNFYTEDTPQAIVSLGRRTNKGAYISVEH